MSRTVSPLTFASAFPLERALVDGCVDVAARPTDALFARALAKWLPLLARADRARLAGITGHVGESIAQLLLAGCGWTPVWHFAGTGGHGVDLLLLGPREERVFAVEVKATFRPGRWPQLTRGAPPQMDAGWLDKADNPALLDWGLGSDDLYGGVIAVNFRDLLYKVALTSDFHTWFPVQELERLEELGWLDAA
jgi:hypothetical protein